MKATKDTGKKSPKHLHEPANQAAIASTTTLSASPKKPAATSERELNQLRRKLWRRLREKFDVGLLYDVLEDAANNMLQQVEIGDLKVSKLFDAEGKLTRLGMGYVEDAIAEAINPGYSGNYSECLVEELPEMLDREAFHFFQAERAKRGWQ